MLKVHHLQLRCGPLLFDNFRWFNIKATLAHHLIIHKGLDEPGVQMNNNLITIYTYLLL